MDKFDVKKSLRFLYTASRDEFTQVDVPTMTYLAVNGEGNPNTSEQYRLAVEALFGLSYTLKFFSKQELRRDYVVAPLEGQWRADDPEVFITRDKDAWSWTMLINQPGWITTDQVDHARRTLAAKKDVPRLAEVDFRTITEGECLQTLHIGPYDAEAPTLHRLHHEVMPSLELTFNGEHHEIYLSDPRRTAPEKLKTILRQPITARELPHATEMPLAVSRG